MSGRKRKYELEFVGNSPAPAMNLKDPKASE